MWDGFPLLLSVAPDQTRSNPGRNPAAKEEGKLTLFSAFFLRAQVEISAVSSSCKRSITSVP